MKSIILFLLTIPFFSNAQSAGDTLKIPRDSANNIVYTGVVNDSASADVLYSRAKLFVADYYNSSKAVTQLNDDATKTVLIKPLVQLTLIGLMQSGYSGYTHYQVKIDCKDNRFRYRIDGFVHNFETGGKMNAKSVSLDLSAPKPKSINKDAWYSLHEQLDTQIQKLITALKKAMQTNSSDF